MKNRWGQEFSILQDLKMFDFRTITSTVSLHFKDKSSSVTFNCVWDFLVMKIWVHLLLHFFRFLDLNFVLNFYRKFSKFERVFFEIFKKVSNFESILENFVF